MIDKALVDFDIDALAMRRATHAFELQLDDVADLPALQRMEDDDFIDPVDEFGPEMAAHDVHDLAAQA